MNFPLFIAKRLYSNQGDKRKVSRPAIHIATAGVAIGLAIMIMSVCVVLGFKHTIRDKVIGFGSHIQEEFNYEGETVMMAPASGFYTTPGAGHNQVRVAYVLKKHDLERALVVLGKALEAYPGRVEDEGL